MDTESIPYSSIYIGYFPNVYAASTWKNILCSFYFLRFSFSSFNYLPIYFISLKLPVWLLACYINMILVLLSIFYCMVFHLSIPSVSTFIILYWLAHWHLTRLRTEECSIFEHNIVWSGSLIIFIMVLFDSEAPEFNMQ